MKLFLIKFFTIFDLGLGNIFDVIIYRFGIKIGLHPVCNLKGDISKGPFFNTSKMKPLDLIGNSNWNSEIILFDHLPIKLKDEYPIWSLNPTFSNQRQSVLKSWYKIQDFSGEIGDIKLVWELSRMDWVMSYAQAAQNGDHNLLVKLNNWISNWSEENPPYYGPNWKCGQETAIRVLHLACAAFILSQEREMQAGLIHLITLHLRRIELTLKYAIAQDNNHGMTEAAALFIGGSWLAEVGVLEGKKWEKIGRFNLEGRVKKLILNDGSFSQYSLNYQRLMIYTLSFTEIWRQHLKLQKFSNTFLLKCSLASTWIYQMISIETGDGPNLGANDGAQFLPLTSSPFRDFRPSVQLCMALFNDEVAYNGKGLWDEHLKWLRVEGGKSSTQRHKSITFQDGGYSILRVENAKVFFRHSNFKFRPSHADALHVDLWVNNINLLNDGGSYSYNSNPDLSDYFMGAKGLNIIEFDGRDLMPRLSKFLYGKWLKTENYKKIIVSSSKVECAARYKDYKNAKHDRQIVLQKNGVMITDIVKGFNTSAILRWRLSNKEWKIKIFNSELELLSMHHKINISSSVPIKRGELIKGWQSLRYNEKTSIPILEVEIDQPGTIQTKYNWSE